MTDTRPPPMTLEEALRVVAALPCRAGASEAVALDRAAGRRLAAPAVAAWPVPRFSSAAVDGWALRAQDLAATGETRLPIRGRLAAGMDAAGHHVAGGAIRIFTGAMMPPDADTVVMQEKATRVGDVVVLAAGVGPLRHVRQRGEQAEAGTAVLLAGRHLRPPDLALAAASGLTALTVRRALRVGILGTGDEIRPIGADLEPAAIPDANGVMIAATLAAWGALPVPAGLVGDDPGALAERLAALAATCDLVVTTGGVSVGEADYLRTALASSGAMLVHRLAMKPGGPTALGSIRDVPVLALPGNPAAAFVALHVLGRPLVRHLGGEPAAMATRLDACAGFVHRKATGAADVLPVRLANRDGRWWADAVTASRGSLAALAQADALAIIPPEAADVARGDRVAIIPIAPPESPFAPDGARMA